jgi:hypothetical protein
MAREVSDRWVNYNEWKFMDEFYNGKDMNKYYNPEIEELRFGFECEKLISKDKWENITFSFSEMFDKNHVWNYKTWEFRVKHLDREDIEECGWEFRNKDTMNRMEFYKGWKEYDGKFSECYHAMYVPLTKHLLISKGDNEIGLFDYQTIFAGTIKNKSELKRLMKQLNITA